MSTFSSITSAISTAAKSDYNQIKDTVVLAKVPVTAAVEQVVVDLRKANILTIEAGVAAVVYTSYAVVTGADKAEVVLDRAIDATELGIGNMLLKFEARAARKAAAKLSAVKA